MWMFWVGISICRVLAMYREVRAYRVLYGVLFIVSIIHYEKNSFPS